MVYRHLCCYLMRPHLILIDLASGEDADNYYVTKLSQMAASPMKVAEELMLGSEEGFDFGVLRESLQPFSVLTSLYISQRRSPDACTLDHFVGCLKCLYLEELHLDDIQSAFLKDIDPFTLFDLLPGNCKYVITCGLHSSKLETTTHIDMVHNKSLLFSRMKET